MAKSTLPACVFLTENIGWHFTLSAQERAYARPSNPAQAELMLAAFSVFQQIFPQIFVRKTWQGGTAFNLSYLIAAARPVCSVIHRTRKVLYCFFLHDKTLWQHCASSPKYHLQVSFACGIDSGQAALFCKIFLKSASFLCRPVF